MRLGVFGGSFDPIHNAHLIVAQTAVEQLGLDRLHFVVSARQPLKSGHGASPLDRLRMVELGVAGLRDCYADGREIARGGVSYTVDTLRELREEFPGAELILLVGEDAANEMPRWHAAEEVGKLATVVIVERAGSASGGVRPTLQLPDLEISSTAVRSRAQLGLGLRGWVPTAVADYISGLSLYQTSGGAA